jgi:osmotically-inducible protein OsmY
MPKRELWQGEREPRWQIMERMEEDRAKRERHARTVGAGGDEGADYRRRLVEQGLAAGTLVPDGDDARLADGIRRRIEPDRHLSAIDITVEVVGGEVMLTGTVADLEAQRRVQALAEQIAGVTRTANRLWVL